MSYSAPVPHLAFTDRLLNALASEQGVCTYVCTSGQLFVTNNAKDAVAYARAMHDASRVECTFRIYVAAKHLCRVPTRVVGRQVAFSARALAVHLGVEVAHAADLTDQDAAAEYFGIVCAIAAGPHANTVVRVDHSGGISAARLLTEESMLLPLGPWLQRAVEEGIPDQLCDDGWRSAPDGRPVQDVSADIAITTENIRSVLHTSQLDLRPVSDQ